ncbi:MAG: hypothetical protein Q7S40_15835 [Opitutaceae bacterium]|nr:hypothetical protein [Opitutaceae bacterium]
MKTPVIRRWFPRSEVSLMHQNGTQLSPTSTGVEVVLHVRENESVPWCAEIVSGEHYAEIGLWFNGTTLADYDGVFFLPRDVAEMLMAAGYAVPKECFA